MYYVKKGYGCGLKISLIQPSGTAVDLRKVRYIAGVLRLPSGQTMTLSDINFDELTNNVFIRLLATRELTTEGNYGLVVNVKLSDNTMYSTQLAEIINVNADNPGGYVEQAIALALTVVNFPGNVDITGCSPKISDKNTWMVYDDTLNAYVDTGVSVGYAELTARYDQKVAEIEAVVTEAKQTADEDHTTATADHNIAVADHEKAVTDHTTATADHEKAVTDHNTAVADHTTATNDHTTATADHGKATEATTAATTAATNATNAATSATNAVANMDTVFGVLAHADVTLEEKIATLAELVVGIITGKVLVESLNVRNLGVWGDNNLVIVSDHAPDKKPDRAGQFWIDIVNNAVWKSTGNGAVSDWKSL